MEENDFTVKSEGFGEYLPEALAFQVLLFLQTLVCPEKNEDRRS
jgi:hypothetical protein